MAIQGQNPNATAQPQKKNFIQKARELVRPPKPSDRIADDFGILKEVAGLRYLQNIKDTEQRRTEIIDVMYQLNDLEFKLIQGAGNDPSTIKKIEQNLLFNSYKLARLFQLFFITGSPWVRGIDNESLSQAVIKFLMNYEVIGDLSSAFPILHTEIMTLMHLSWQGIDVTNTPAYVISSTPIFTPANVPRIDMTGGATNAQAGDPAGTERKPGKSTDI